MSDLLRYIQEFFARDALLVILDTADIALVAAIVYRVLLAVKGTRAVQMAIGLALVFLAHQLADSLKLITLWTMLDAVTTYLVLIIVVIFQNDIRRALMRVGRRPLFRFGSARETHVLEEVVKACTNLAQKRVGALIVFERDAALDEFIEPGTELDAAVSKELLFSVFIPSYENPMHDGAVIIREGRIMQAGAFLPLTAKSGLDRSIGTRHRAAIGITEETDAVAVVVSEERGKISMCYPPGNFVKDLEPNAFREALVGLFHSRPKPKPKPSKREASEKVATAGPEVDKREGPPSGISPAVVPEKDS
ncbi:MAG: diadenylate cyclase CdaA [Myxococcota bacterium]